MSTPAKLPLSPPPKAESFRTLDELDALAPNDPERDEICKRLSPAEQIALMGRYGFGGRH